jgi:FkbM family methyltransferase
MFFPAQRKGFGKFIYTFREYYEPELAYLEKLLSPGKVFIDVGANFGVYTLVASKLVGAAGNVFALEPAAQSFAILRQNIALNHSANVRSFQVALTQTRGKAWLYHGWDPVGNSLGMDPLCGNQGEEVQTESLDSLLEENGIDRVDVIKVDVEGAEELVLRGATKTLITNRPVIIFEYNPGCSARLSLSPYGARDLLESLGYEFVVLGDCARSNAPESGPTYFNIVAIPKQSAGEFAGSFHSLIEPRNFCEAKP